jgi:DNA repair exonuclease SbcCD ATPase subunit
MSEESDHFDTALENLSNAINSAETNKGFLEKLPKELSGIAEKIGQIKETVEGYVERLKNMARSIGDNVTEIKGFDEKIKLLEARITELTSENQRLTRLENEMNTLNEALQTAITKGNEEKTEELSRLMREKGEEINRITEENSRNTSEFENRKQQEILALQQELNMLKEEKRNAEIKNEQLNNIIAKATPLVLKATEILEKFVNPRYTGDIQKEIAKINSVIQDLYKITNTVPISSSSSTPSGNIVIEGEDIIINTDTGKKVKITKTEIIQKFVNFLEGIDSDLINDEELKSLKDTFLEEEISADEKFRLFIDFVQHKISMLDVENRYTPDELLNIFVKVGIMRKDINQYLKNTRPEPGTKETEPETREGGKTKKNKNKTKKNKTKKTKKIRKYKGGFKYSTSSNRKSSKRSFTSRRNTPSKRSSSRRTTVSSRSK